jgi:hypothetical protein
MGLNIGQLWQFAYSYVCNNASREMPFLTSVAGDILFGLVQFILELGPYLRRPWACLLLGAVSFGFVVFALVFAWGQSFLGATFFGVVGIFGLYFAWRNFYRRDADSAAQQ